MSGLIRKKTEGIILTDTWYRGTIFNQKQEKVSYYLIEVQINTVAQSVIRKFQLS